MDAFHELCSLQTQETVLEELLLSKKEHNWIYMISVKLLFCTIIFMAVASSPAGPVLGGPVFTVIFAQIMNNEQHVWGASFVDTHFLHWAIAGTRTSPRSQQQAVSPIQRYSRKGTSAQGKEYDVI